MFSTFALKREKDVPPTLKMEASLVVPNLEEAYEGCCHWRLLHSWTV